MKVGIDASRAFLKERTGTEEYAYRLIKNLTKISDPFCQFFLFVKKGAKIDLDLPDNFHIKNINREKYWTQIGLSMELFFNPVDALFVPSHSAPFIHPKRTVVMIHGLEYRNCPKCYSRRDRFFLELNTMLSAKWAKKIITPSASTKKDLVKFYGISPEKIAVIHHGAEDREWNVEGRKWSQQKGGGDKNCFNILSLGRLEKRKNIVNLVKAFNILKEKKPRVDLKLILAGKPGFGFGEIQKEIDSSKWKGDITATGYISESEKEDLYEKADMFVMPSLAEGFGMPILEAMQRRVPVLCSDITPFFEIAMDCVLYFDPKSCEDIADKIGMVVANEHLRNDLIERGTRNLENFSWEKCVKETLDVLLDRSIV